jgi:hypothetical protein
MTMASGPIPIPYEIADGKKMFKRSDLWRLQYRVTRYMAHIPNEELDERNTDVFSNIMYLTPEGQLAPTMIGGDSPIEWTELWTHIMEEYGLRGRGMPGGFVTNAQMPRPVGEGRLAKGTLALQRRGISPNGKIIKFGREEHLREALLKGRLRIAPASSYQGDSCRARQDSELEISYRWPAFVRHPDATQLPDERFPNRLAAVMRFSAIAPSDYYTACFARTFVHRLFDDFDANSCLVVVDEELFKQKMLAGFATFRPKWPGICRQVDYIDPLLPTSHPDIYFAKHFRYAYQQEFRFVWKPPVPVRKLSAAFIETGPLHDCCELLTSEEVNSSSIKMSAHPD